MLLVWGMLILFMLALVIMGLANFISMKTSLEYEKPSPFECGFSIKLNNWVPFSMHFFMSALVFLVFDIELILVFPYLMFSDWYLSSLGILVSVVFLFSLSVGFIIEWSQKYLDWVS